MANRSDRDPPSLHPPSGHEPTEEEMRRESADSIRASRNKPCIRPDIKLQPDCSETPNLSLPSGGVHIKTDGIFGKDRPPFLTLGDCG